MIQLRTALYGQHFLSARRIVSDYSNASITGSSSSDIILARKKNIFVKGGAGADIFQFKSTGTVSDYEGADKAMIYNEDGVKKFFKNESREAVKFNSAGTSAKLTVHYDVDDFDAANYSISPVTIQLGIKFMAGTDVFIYRSGDGTDTITDYTSLDTLIILSGSRNKFLIPHS
ncbi:MAG: hypothetical protein IJG80_08270 [Selenomonadaceae bacterium]|nr:hypothetical protein [Selenomonadaceae bacterium]